MSPFTSHVLLSIINSWDTKEVLLWIFLYALFYSSECCLLPLPLDISAHFCLSSLSVPHSILISTCVWHALTAAKNAHTHIYTLTCAELMPLGGICQGWQFSNVSALTWYVNCPVTMEIQHFLPCHPGMWVCTWACISILHTHTHATMHSSTTSLSFCVLGITDEPEN